MESSFAMRQSLFVIIAPVIMTIMINIPYYWFKRFANGLYVAIQCCFFFVVWIFNRADRRESLAGYPLGIHHSAL